MANSDVRFGIKVISDNDHHVHFRLFAATGGQHLGGCGQLVMQATEYAVFRELLAPALTDRTGLAPVVMGICGEDGLCRACTALEDLGEGGCGRTYPRPAQEA